MPPAMPLAVIIVYAIRSRGWEVLSLLCRGISPSPLAHLNYEVDDLFAYLMNPSQVPLPVK